MTPALAARTPYTVPSGVPAMAGSASTSSVRRRRRRGLSPAQWGLAVVFAIAIHVPAGALVFGNIARDLYGGLLATVLAPKDEAVEELVALEPSCSGDALLVAAAESAMCATPFYVGPSCLDDVNARLGVELARCKVLAAPPPVEIAFLDPVAARTLASIDPEPLLEDMIATPPPPQPQQPTPPPQVAMAPPPPPPPPPKQRNTQIIETVKPDKDTPPPENTRFLSEYNTRVEKQTVARGSRAEELVNKPKAEELAAKADPREASAEAPKEETRPGANDQAPPVPGKLSMRPPGTSAPAGSVQDEKVKGALGGSTAPVGDGSVARRGDGAFSQERREIVETPRGEGGGGGGAPRVPDLKSQQVLERVAGGGSVDHLEDVEEGDENAFSSRAWVGASFINRAKRQVGREWDPGRVWLQHDPNGQVYGLKSRVTVLRVTLAPDGKLMKAVILQPSGVDFLDEEAVRAFRAAAPFPNPPEVLRDKDGFITFNFGFHFEIGGRKGWKIFRTL
jgi:TonB family protein